MVVQDNARTLSPVLECLAAVADEIVVVDGGSRDGTDEIAAAHPAVRFYRRAFDGNIAVQKNFACDQAYGDWLLILDSDELLSAATLEAVPRLIRNPLASWYKFSREWLVEKDGRLWRLQSPLHHPDFQLRLFRNRPPFRYDLSRSPIHHNFPKRGRGWGRKMPRLAIQHFDLLLNSRAAREAKVERYREMDAASERTHGMYLWEDLALDLVPTEVPVTLARSSPPQAAG